MSVRQTDGLFLKYNPKQINVETKAATTYFAEGFWNEGRTAGKANPLDQHKMRKRIILCWFLDVRLFHAVDFLHNVVFPTPMRPSITIFDVP